MRLADLRLISCAVFITIVFTSACGYVGPVLPPSPGIPSTITDLSAAERGDKIVVFFTTPARTTDGVAITSFADIELRVGPRIYSVDPPPASDKADPQPKPVSYSVPVSDWAGQRVALDVRTAARENGHFSAWSNQVGFDVIPPLEKPVVQHQGTASGIVLTWERIDDAQYLIQRQSAADKQPIELVTVNENRYVDVSAQYDIEYRYTVTAKKGLAESLPYETLSFSVPDTFAPAVPAGLTVLAAPDAVDLVWQRNTEADLQGYFIYRSANGGLFERQGNVVPVPTYADHLVEHGKTYAYKISAIDKKGNESAASSVSEVQY